MTERIHIQLPMHMGVFNRLLTAIAGEFPGAELPPATASTTAANQVVIEVDPDATHGDQLLEVIGKAADDLAELDHGGPLERALRTAMAQLQTAAAPRPLRVETYRTETPATDLPDSDVLVEHRWRVVHTSNGEIMASGEGYTDRRDRDHAVATLWPGIDVVEVDR